MHVSLDTNIFISISKQEFDHAECQTILEAINLRSWKCSISAIVVAELLFGAYRNGKDLEAEFLARKLADSYEIQPMDLEIVKMGAKFRAKINLRLPDALIIGSAVHRKVDCLISRDIKMNKHIPLSILTPIEFVKKYLS